MWQSIRPLLAVADTDPDRFTGVQTLGVDEHVWHHVSTIHQDSHAAGHRFAEQVVTSLPTVGSGYRRRRFQRWLGPRG